MSRIAFLEFLSTCRWMTTGCHTVMEYMVITRVHSTYKTVNYWQDKCRPNKPRKSKNLSCLIKKNCWISGMNPAIKTSWKKPLQVTAEAPYHLHLLMEDQMEYHLDLTPLIKSRQAFWRLQNSAISDRWPLILQADYIGQKGKILRQRKFCIINFEQPGSSSLKGRFLGATRPFATFA